ncbi:MAG: ATP-binding protein [Marmoricola sp.]
MSLALLPDASSVAVARAAARSCFEEHGVPITLDVELVVSELVTNAVRYGAGDIALDVTLTEGQAVIAVHDGSQEVPVLRRPDRVTSGGRGLRIVAEVATDWGVSLTALGKTVWCLVATGATPPGDQAL